MRYADVDDLVQDVIVRFFSAVSEFEYDPKKGRFRSYLKVCAWRVLQRRLGKDLNINGRSIDQIDAGELSVEAAWNDIWETEQLRQAVEIVRRDCGSRPDRARTFAAFEMYVLLERPIEEISRELEMSVDSIHQAKSRITKAIKSAMLDINTAIE